MTVRKNIFVAQPTTPYYKGDLWAQGLSGDLMVCVNTRETGSYQSGDWEKASKYTDDSTANKINTKGLGVKVNYSTFTTQANGRLYMHGFSSGEPADVMDF